MQHDNTAEKRMEIAINLIRKASRSRSPSLNLSGLELPDLPMSLASLGFLRNLNLSRNSLTAVPSSVHQLTHLQVLDLSGNDIDVLPKWLGSLRRLQSLMLGRNQLKCLPETISQLAHLRELKASNNQISTLPESIGELEGLHTLDLTDNRLNLLPPSVGRLTQLQKLQLTDNNLRELPELLGHLSNLTGLYLSSNQLRTLPKGIEGLNQLEKLSLAGNQFEAIPESICVLIELRMLNLAGNRLTGLPMRLSSLKKLRQLFLDGNKITSLPDGLRELVSLKELYLHGNEALGLPPEVLGPTKREVSVGGASPARAAEILDYYFRTRGGSQPLNEAKLIIVGRGGVGKTCIVNRLVHDRFDPGEKKTDGIQITNWKVKLDGDDSEVRLNIWDFGGQEIMHSTHQFFLTQRSLYLLVLNGREGREDTDAEYWLQLIESFGGDSPVVVVQNKIREQIFDLNRRALSRKYPGIRAFIKTDCSDRSGLDELAEAIIRETSHLEDIRSNFPASWFLIKNHLSGMEENYLSFEQFRHLCEQLGEPDSTAQEHLAANLHRLGIALNFKDDVRLRDTHVLNPHWITNGIYKILNSEMLAKQRGILRLVDIAEILDSQDYPLSKHLFLLDLMKRFELCFEFPDDPDHRYLIPELLDKQEPELGEAFRPEKCLNFQYHYGILPEGILPRFIVRSHVLSTHQARWRSGVVLEFEGDRALVKADTRDGKVSISVIGRAKGMRRLLAVIRSDFEAIHADIKNLHVTEMVPVSGRPEVVIPYNKLRVLEDRGKTTFEEVVGGDLIELDVKEMLDGIDLKGVRKLAASTKGRHDVSRVFISYSHKDEVYRAELETHLKLLQRQGLVSVWTDRKIAPGDKWEGMIDDNLESAAIILLLISADFLASDYCYEKEMQRALERHKAGQTNVIPVIVRDVDWHSAPFAKLQALPRDAKPITLWPNRDSAWRDVAHGIRLIAGRLESRGFT